MPELTVGSRQWPVAPQSNLLDALNVAGLKVPFSCRAGSCHACLVRCVAGQPSDALPEALPADKRAEGWRLACQCRVVEDLAVEVFDPLRDGLPAKLVATEWLAPSVLRLRVLPARPLRYRAGQHLVLWSPSGVARPYSLASLPGDDVELEFHIDCRRPGAFVDEVQQLKPGADLRLGELRGGALHYDPVWQARPLLLLASGTGLAPLWGLLREALREGHEGSIRVVHIAQDAAGHYLAQPLQALMEAHPQVSVELVLSAESADFLAQLRLASRQTIALLCGYPSTVEQFAKRLFLAGLPRGQLFADAFLDRQL